MAKNAPAMVIVVKRLAIAINRVTNRSVFALHTVGARPALVFHLVETVQYVLGVAFMEAIQLIALQTTMIARMMRFAPDYAGRHVFQRRPSNKFLSM
ncbi:MAG: hypothetical protein PHU25_07625 [Deltaproteobacteria bacterium]|nr:hypothetical protein [Deltaproteobacteria bacterium]